MREQQIIASVDDQRSIIEPQRPKWDDMKLFYPDTNVKTVDLYNFIGGGLPEYFKNDPVNWENSCCIRMSKALNYSGVALPKAPSSGGTIKGSDGYNYWIRVNDMKKYLSEKFGNRDIEAIGGLNAVDQFKGKKGIIVFDVTGWGNASGHFTLWDGKNLVYPGDPLHDDPNSEYYYFSMRYTTPRGVVKTEKIRLWELK